MPGWAYPSMVLIAGFLLPSAWRWRSSEPPLALQVGLVLGPQPGGGLQDRYLGRGDVPPGPGAGQVGVRDDRHHDHHRAGMTARAGQRVPQFGRGPRTARAGAEAGRDLRQVEAEVVALQPR